MFYNMLSMSIFYFCITEPKTIVMTPVRGHSRIGRKAQREKKLLRITNIYYVGCCKKTISDGEKLI